MKNILTILLASATASSAGEYCWTNFATGAPFAGAYGATVDSDGTIYAAALTSQQLTKITPAGVVTILGAAVPSPVELVISTTTHNLYVGSNGGGVYKVVPPYGAGNVTQIDSGYTCFGLGVDSASETIYAGDRGGNTIRVMPSSGPGTVLAGTGAAGSFNHGLSDSTFNAPCGIAVVVSGGNTILYVADQVNGLIRQIDINGGTVTTLAGGGAGCNADGTGTAASFSGAVSGCTLGPDGNLYIADQDNLTIRKITLPDGVVTTIGGSPDIGGPCHPTYDNANGCGSAGHFSDVGQVGVSSGGILYVADRGNGDIKKGTPPAALARTTITRISFTAVPANDFCWTNFAGPGGNFAGSYGAAVDSDNTIYVSALDVSVLSKITPAGAASSLGASVPSPVELSVSKTTHNLYVASLGIGSGGGASAGTYKVAPPYGAGNVTLIDGGYVSFATAVDSASETVYAANTGGNKIRLIPNGGAGRDLAGNGTAGFVDNTTLAAAEFSVPCGIAVVVSGGNTNLYVADRGNSRIRRIDIGNNLVSTVAGSGPDCADGVGTAAGFFHPTGCTLGPDGNLYVADQDDFTVRKITLPGGVVTTVGGLCGESGAVDGCTTNSRFGNLGQIGVSSSLILYAADRGGRLVKGTPPGSTLQVQIDFTGGNDTFTLQSSSTVNGTYTDVLPVVTATPLGGGSFRFLTPITGAVQFYRIKSS